MNEIQQKWEMLPDVALQAGASQEARGHVLGGSYPFIQTVLKSVAD